MITTLGALALAVAFIVALYAMLAGLIGGKRRVSELVDSARNGVIVNTVLVSIAVGAMGYALVTRDFSIALVANHSSRDLPLFPYTLTALWSGQAGSLLFWSWILSLYGIAVVLRKWQKDRDLMPYVISVMMLIQAFFGFMLTFISSPFEKMPFTPNDGQGLNPLLQHPAMAIHPPLLYLGYVGFTIPFCFGMASLISGRLNDSWIRTTRRWSILPWLFLGMGLIGGGRWAYDVLGWGGYWGWDPVENAALMPWLVGTAFLHSVMVQERKGMLKVWNMGLIIITFALVMFGTFLTRSGVVQSVHSFATSVIGPWLLGFVGIVVIGSTALLATRLNKMQSEDEFDSVWSREVLFLLNNVLFLGAAIAVLIGVIWPVLSELVTGQTLTVGPPYYNLVVGSIFAGIVLLMGVIPLIGWASVTLSRLGRKLIFPISVTALVTLVAFVAGVREVPALVGVVLILFAGTTTLTDIVESTRARMKNTHENLFLAFARLLGKNRRRYGGYLIHLSVVIMAVGFIGSRVYATDETRALSLGESWTTQGYTLTFEDIQPGVQDGEGVVTTAVLGAFENGKRVATLKPKSIYFDRQQQSETLPAIWQDAPFFRRDLYVIVQGWDNNFSTVSFRAYVNPLIAWVWWGAGLYFLFTLVTMWPDPAEARSRVQEFVGAGVPAE